MATVMTAMADDGVSVVLSSHVLAELERVADYLVLIAHGRVRLDGHGGGPARLSPAGDRPGAGRARTPGWEVIESSRDRRPQTHQLVRLPSTEPAAAAGRARRGRSASKNSPWPTSAKPPARQHPP